MKLEIGNIVRVKGGVDEWTVTACAISSIRCVLAGTTVIFSRGEIELVRKAKRTRKEKRYAWIHKLDGEIKFFETEWHGVRSIRYFRAPSLDVEIEVEE